mmetsp:Transcript_9395/g.10858  ORF Transcript_9395/g.10858 Transcript_9395/m.10858 type:complete len:105 (-) Transcript_9395:116-430(-)
MMQESMLSTQFCIVSASEEHDCVHHMMGSSFPHLGLMIFDFPSQGHSTSNTSMMTRSSLLWALMHMTSVIQDKDKFLAAANHTTRTPLFSYNLQRHELGQQLKT